MMVAPVDEKAEETIVPPTPPHQAHEENESMVILERGTLVRLHGFEDVGMNGRTGTVASYMYERENDPLSKSYEVALDQPNNIAKHFNVPIVRIKPENLVAISFVECMKLQGFDVDKCTPFEIATPITESAPSTTDTATPTQTMMVLGGGLYRRSGHVDFLPRNAKLPSRKFTFHNDICKELVNKLYNEGDFVVGWRHLDVVGQGKIKRKCLDLRFGLEESQVRQCFPNDDHISPVLKRGPLLFLIRIHVSTPPVLDEKDEELPEGTARLTANEKRENLKGTKDYFSSQGKEKDEETCLIHQPNHFINNLLRGCAADTFRDLRCRLLRHMFRQHAVKILPDMRDVLVLFMRPFYAPNSISGTSKRKKLLEYLDLIVTESDIEASLQGFTYSSSLARIGQALEALEQNELAGQLYVWAAEHFCENSKVPESNSEWKMFMIGALAYQRAGMAVPSEHSYVRALHWKYKHDGNRLLLHDAGFCRLMNNMLAMYWHFASIGDSMIFTNVVHKGSISWGDCILMGILQMLLCVAGFQTSQKIKLSTNKVSLRPKYRNASAALAALIEACHSGTVEGFRSKVIGCRRNDSVQLLFRLNPAPARPSHLQLDRAKKVIQKVCCDGFKTSTSRKCSFFSCQNHEVLNTTTSKGIGTLMQCPCKTVTYCSKECQAADWKAHKKYCQFYLATKKQKSYNSK
jgi:MYND finger